MGLARRGVHANYLHGAGASDRQEFQAEAHGGTGWAYRPAGVHWLFHPDRNDHSGEGLYTELFLVCHGAFRCVRARVCVSVCVCTFFSFFLSDFYRNRTRVWDRMRVGHLTSPHFFNLFFEVLFIILCCVFIIAKLKSC